MDAVSFSEVLAAVAKGGPPAFIIAIFYGAAVLVREVRGGKAGEQEKAHLAGKISQLEAQVAALTSGMARMEHELEVALDLIHSMRYQRDRARVRVEYLEQLHGTEPRTEWPPEPDQKGEP